MRRWLTATALGAAAALALTGCAPPGGADGNLTDDWAAVAEPRVFVPAAGTCHPRFREIAYLGSYQPVDCARSHTVETMHVGTFTGRDADRTTPPPAGSPGLRAARVECDTRASEALRADWRGARLSLSVVLPSTLAWSGGARWFRCDLSEVKSLDSQEFVAREGSLNGALGKPSDLAHGCFRPKLVADEIDAMTPVPCTSRHRSEFVGIWTAPDTSYPAFEKNAERVRKGCLGLVASFAKVPDDADLRFRAGTIYYYPQEAEWKAGNRGVQCFLWVSDRDLSRSVRGAGARALPVR